MSVRASISIPRELKPGDGRFGCGPSKVVPSSSNALAAERAADRHVAPPDAGQGPRRPRPRGLRELFVAPDGYEVALGNGGTTAFWDAAAFGLVRERALHLTRRVLAEVRRVTGGARSSPTRS